MISTDRIAFLILAHGNPDHLLRLCERLGSSDDIYVHWDKRARLSDIEALPFASNVRFLRSRVPVFWSDISIVEATLALLSEALNSGRPYLRLVLLTGACYPIKPVAQLRSYLAGAPERNNISFVDMTQHWDQLAWRIDRYNFRRPLCWPYTRYQVTNYYLNLPEKAVRRLATLGLRGFSRGYHKKFPGLTPYLGSQLWALSQQCAEMIVGYSKRQPEFLKFERWTWAPDEHYVQTVVGNSAFETDGLKPYTGDHNIKLGNLHLIRYAYFTMDDLDLIRSTDKFFMRKTEPSQSRELFSYIDNHLL